MTALPPTLRPEFAAPSLARGPWGLRALLALVGVDLIVVGTVVTAWYHAAQLATPQQQIGWMDLAGVALLVGLGAHTGWLVAGRRAVGSRSRAVERATESVLSPLTVDTSQEIGDELVLTGDRMTLFHRPGCPLVEGRSTEALAARAALAKGLAACSMCEPA
ncbi:MAG: hypothetical protein QOE84_2146 [Actinomycetota bacterium]|nr:hypothetical protein [Actinomycetota bacterium]